VCSDSERAGNPAQFSGAIQAYLDTSRQAK
jgi:hypothetical protein